MKNHRTAFPVFGIYILALIVLMYNGTTRTEIIIAVSAGIPQVNYGASHS
ncbi:MAG TPA: hypothetical protein ACFYD4_12725 [Candidatus Wunengus sp. YC61]